MVHVRYKSQIIYELAWRRRAKGQVSSFPRISFDLDKAHGSVRQVSIWEVGQFGHAGTQEEQFTSSYVSKGTLTTGPHLLSLLRDSSSLPLASLSETTRASSVILPPFSGVAVRSYSYSLILSCLLAPGHLIHLFKNIMLSSLNSNHSIGTIGHEIVPIAASCYLSSTFEILSHRSLIVLYRLFNWFILTRSISWWLCLLTAFGVRYVSQWYNLDILDRPALRRSPNSVLSHAGWVRRPWVGATPAAIQTWNWRRCLYRKIAVRAAGRHHRGSNEQGFLRHSIKPTSGRKTSTLLP